MCVCVYVCVCCPRLYLQDVPTYQTPDKFSAVVRIDSEGPRRAEMVILQIGSRAIS